MRLLALGLALTAALAMAGCSSTQVAHQPTPAPVTRPAPAPAFDTLKVDQVAGPDPSVVIDQGPIAIRKVPPEYPMSTGRGVQGLVRVQALIGADGRVNDTRIAESVPLLDEAAMTAIRQWEFKPAMAKGQAVPVWVTIPVRFSIH